MGYLSEVYFTRFKRVRVSTTPITASTVCYHNCLHTVEMTKVCNEPKSQHNHMPGPPSTTDADTSELVAHLCYCQRCVSGCDSTPCCNRCGTYIDSMPWLTHPCVIYVRYTPMKCTVC